MELETVRKCAIIYRIFFGLSSLFFVRWVFLCDVVLVIFSFQEEILYGTV